MADRIAELRSVNPFVLRDFAFAHGWIALPPFAWDADAGQICRVDRLASGTVVAVRIAAEDADGVTDCFRLALDGGAALAPADWAEVVERATWWMRLEEDLTDFARAAAAYPGLAPVVARGAGRLLRAPSLFEDLVKVLCTTNTTWEATVRMVTALVERYGDPSPLGRAFPTPEALAAVSEEDLARETRVGYRARSIVRLARAVAAGELALDARAWAALPAEELHRRLRALHGIGEYSAAALELLLGHYERLPIDAWLRRVVREAWFDGASVADAEVAAAFAPLGRWKALFYWMNPEFHAERDRWADRLRRDAGPEQKE